MQDALLSLYVTEYFLYNTHYLYKIHIPNLDIYLSINQEILIPSDQIFLKERQQIYHPASTISDIQIVDKQKELWICAKLSHY